MHPFADLDGSQVPLLVPKPPVVLQRPLGLVQLRSQPMLLLQLGVVALEVVPRGLESARACQCVPIRL